MIIIFSYIPVYKYNINTMKAQCRVYELLTIARDESNEDCFQLDILNFQREQKKIREK